jgi:hypothetical protein
VWNKEIGERTRNFSDSRQKNRKPLVGSANILAKKEGKCERMLEFIKLAICEDLML